MFGCRYVQAGLSHESKKSHGFQAYRLTTGVRAGDDQQVIGVSQTDIHRNDHPAVNQRMPCPAKIYDPVLIEVRHSGIHFSGKLRAGKDEIQRSQHFHVGYEIFAVFRCLFTEGSKDLLNLRLFVSLQLTDVIVQLHDRHGLDKQRGAGGGLVMDHTRHLGAVFGADRDTVTAVTLGDQCVLKILSRRSVDDLRKLGMDPLLGQMDLPADPAKLGGGVVRDLFFGEDAAADLTAQGYKRIDAAEHICQRILREVLFFDVGRYCLGSLVPGPVRSYLVFPAAVFSGAGTGTVPGAGGRGC